ncbi:MULTISPECIES: amino acid ABC transporter permease [unclassified Enterococcus]|uniref:amino acid ABC transporter permease n=1 Tax=unclassified Enterococcus TaxID=2608891 RepID=UPI00155333AE|nr:MULTISPECIES: amino acid ABC transporter permease [unclassified Enterococcus]MBS7576438.1 amino acid ABC transporter permease [Enterococcus sp. MMGLQ5-2]MBS7583670.1 amino acid ABC transporter permease [Enterococcus sp. MMGLQ5-1]NPD11531.1 amino acid ABC transporter permease [Enterococcus sp. MMGLQ5-1]NPD36275.1 amino acid ABC transporter permease [Enterococcus sp. MMGLQ5-2]
MNKLFNVELAEKYFPKILSALPVTLQIVFVATVIGLIIGAVIALIRIEKIPILNQFSIVFVSFIRGTPILVQLFIVYYGLPELLTNFGLDVSQLNKMYFLYVTYGLNTAAFQSETIRAAILSVPETQIEAALACGLTKRQAYLKVIFPQAVRIAIPSFGTATISLLQETSLAFTIGVLDVVGRAKALGAVSFHLFEGYVDAAIIFIICSLLLEQLFKIIERRMTFDNKISPLEKKSGYGRFSFIKQFFIKTKEAA